PDRFPQERGVQLRGAGEPGRARAPPLQRCRPGGGVDPHVVLVLDPGGEPAVELLQPGRYPAAGGGLAVGGDPGQELAPHRFEKAFYLAAALGPVRRRVSDPDAQLRAGHRSRLIGEARPVIDIQRPGQAPGRNGPLERRGQVQRVLAPPPPVPGDEPGMEKSRKNTRSRSACDGGPAYRPYAAASSSVRNSTGIDRTVGANQDHLTRSNQTVTRPCDD